MIPASRITETGSFAKLESMKNNLTDGLRKENYDLIDFLPCQVSKGKGHYFEVEKYLLKHRKEIFGKYAEFFLKLYCYCDFEIDFNKKEYSNPSPKKLKKLIMECAQKQLILQIYVGETDFLIAGDELYITVFGLDDNLRELVEKTAGSVGLFLRNRTVD